MDTEEKILAVLEKQGEMLAQMQGDLAGVKADLVHVKARLDYDVDKKLGAINEGVDAILETMVSKSRVEALEDDVIVLKAAVKMLTQEVAELKRAQ